MNAGQLITKLEYAEVNSRYQGDTRRMLQEERFALQAAVQTAEPRTIKEAMDEAQRVAKMWGVRL